MTYKEVALYMGIASVTTFCIALYPYIGGSSHAIGRSYLLFAFDGSCQRLQLSSCVFAFAQPCVRLTFMSAE